MKLKYILGSGIILIFVIFAGISLKNSMTPYVPLEKARQVKTTVQIKGERIPGTEEFDIEAKVLRFQMKDPKGEVFDVEFNGVKPANFEQAREIVAIGKFRDGKFEAEQLLVKCPSKYQAEGVQS